MTSNLTDFDAVLPAFDGVDTVVHLAAEPRHTPDIWWDLLLPDNVTATANVFEAARRGGASRVVFFSSMHVNGMYERDEPWRSIAEGEYNGLDPDDVPLVTHDMPLRTGRAVCSEQDIRRIARQVLRRRVRDDRHLRPARHHERRRSPRR